MSRRGLLGGIGAGAVGLVLLAVVVGRRTSTEAPPSAPPVSAPAAPVFHEQLEGGHYRNADLRISVRAPEGWNGSLGDRSQDRDPYEGLVVKMTPTAGAAESGMLQPFVTVVKRTLPAQAPRDPLAYIAREVLTPEKNVTEPPSVITLCGRPAGRVGFQVGSGPRALRVIQIVYLSPDQAIVVTATAPTGAFDGWREKFEQVFNSVKLES